MCTAGRPKSNLMAFYICAETVESEINKLEEQALELETTNNLAAASILQPSKVLQSVKYIVNLMSDLCTLDIMQTVEALIDSCRDPTSIVVRLQ